LLSGVVPQAMQNRITADVHSCLISLT